MSDLYCFLQIFSQSEKLDVFCLSEVQEICLEAQLLIYFLNRMKKIYQMNVVLPLLVTFLLFWGGGQISAQTITISGKVTDQSSTKPISGVTVSVESDQTGAMTDEVGNYSFTVEKKGRNTLSTQFVLTNYVTQVREIPLDGENVTFNVVMMDSTLNMDDIVITASKGLQQEQADVTVSISTVKQRAIDLQATPSVDKIIAQIPGVDNLDGQINIRGSSGYAYGVGSRVMVLMDGLPLITGDAGGAELSLIPVDNISQIEVMKGASSVLYGSSALGGVINVITGDPGDQPRSSIRLRSGYYGTPQNSILKWDTAATFEPDFASAHMFHQRKIGEVGVTAQLDLIKDRGYRYGTKKNEQRAIVHLKWQSKKIQGLSVALNTAYRRDESASAIFWNRYFPNDTVVAFIKDPVTLKYPDSVTYTGGGLYPNAGAGVYRQQLNTRFSIDPVVKYLNSKGQLFWYRGRLLNNKNTNNTGQGANSYVAYNDFLYQQPLWKNKLNFVAGGTVSYAMTNSYEGLASVPKRDIKGNIVKDANGNIVMRDSVKEGVYNGKYDQTSMAGYTQLDGKFGRWNLSLGARFETTKTKVLGVDINGQHQMVAVYDSALLEKGIYQRNADYIQKRAKQPIFRFGANYEIARGTNVRASFGQAFRVPSLAEYFARTNAGGIVVQPNLEKLDVSRVIKPETGFSMELGFRQGYMFGETNQTTKKFNGFKGYVDVAGFLMRYNQMMEFGVDTVIIGTKPNGTTSFGALFTTRNVTDARIQGLEFTTINSYTMNDWTVNLSGGFTFLDAKNLNPNDSLKQLDLSMFNAAGKNDLQKEVGPALYQINIEKRTDSPTELKYRNKWLTRATVGVNYKGFGFTTNFRYRSFTKTIDQYLYLAVADLKYFRDKHPNGEAVMDCIFSYDFKAAKTNSTVSLTIDNILNAEYWVIPGTLAPQRTFTMQYQFKF